MPIKPLNFDAEFNLIIFFQCDVYIYEDMLIGVYLIKCFMSMHLSSNAVCNRLIEACPSSLDESALCSL